MGQSHGKPLSLKAATTIPAYRVVAMSSAYVVGLADTVTSLPIGVTLDTVLETQGAVPIATAGDIAKVFFNDTAAAGAKVGFDASGRGVTFAQVTASTAFLGVLVGDAVAATGTIADVFIAPSFDNIP